MFDTKRFAAAEFAERTRDVPVPGLARFFTEGSQPVLTVRCLSGEELARVNEEVEKNKLARKALSSAAASASQEVADAVRTLLTGVRGGGESGTPDGFVLSLNLVHTALVTPRLEFSQVVRIATFFPVEFGALRIAVLELLGMGYDIKKPPTSTANPG